MNIIFASIIDKQRFGLIVDMDNKIVGGVARLSRLENHYGDSSLRAALRREGIKSTSIDIVWDWCRPVDPVKFVEEQEWMEGLVIDEEPIKSLERKTHD